LVDHLARVGLSGLQGGRPDGVSSAVEPSDSSFIRVMTIAVKPS
jgi:hypothetical protein